MVARQLGAATCFPGWLSYKAYGHGRAMLAPTGVFRQSGLPPRGKVAPQGRMRGELPDISRKHAVMMNFALISPLRGQLPPMGKPFSASPKKACPAFFCGARSIMIMYNYSSFSHGIRLRNNAAAAKAAQESSSKSIKTPCIPQSICASAANTATPCPAEAAAQSTAVALHKEGNFCAVCSWI